MPHIGMAKAIGYLLTGCLNTYQQFYLRYKVHRINTPKRSGDAGFIKVQIRMRRTRSCCFSKQTFRNGVINMRIQNVTRAIVRNPLPPSADTFKGMAKLIHFLSKYEFKIVQHLWARSYKKISALI